MPHDYENYIVINPANNDKVDQIHKILSEYVPNSRIIVNDEKTEYDAPTQFMILTDTKSKDIIELCQLLTKYDCDIS